MLPGAAGGLQTNGIEPPAPLAVTLATAAFDDELTAAPPPAPSASLGATAVVKLDEKGTEAAAATAVVMAPAGAAMPSKPPIEFRADHPFLFFLRDVRSGTILFMGRVSDPALQ